MLKNINFDIIKSKFKSLSANAKKIVLIVVLIILAIIFFVTFIFKNKKNNDEIKNYISVDNYVSDIENRLEKMLVGYLDVNTAKVFVMTTGSIKTNYLMETTETETTNTTGSTKTSSSKVVYEKSNGVTSPIVVSTTYPEIIGVMIRTNSISASTKISIKNSVSMVLNIPEESISILQEK